MLKELKRVGAVAAEGGHLRAARRYYMPARFDAQWVLNAGSMLRDLGASISHNLTAVDRDPSRFVGRATNDSVDASALPAFREFVEARGQAFLETIDEWLTAHGQDPGKRPGNGKPVRLGLGVFLIQGE